MQQLAACAHQLYASGSKYPIFEVSGPKIRTLNGIWFGTRVLKYWVLGPPGYDFGNSLAGPPADPMDPEIPSWILIGLSRRARISSGKCKLRQSLGLVSLDR